MFIKTVILLCLGTILPLTLADPDCITPTYNILTNTNYAINNKNKGNWEFWGFDEVRGEQMLVNNDWGPTPFWITHNRDCSKGQAEKLKNYAEYYLCAKLDNGQVGGVEFGTRCAPAAIPGLNQHCTVYNKFTPGKGMRFKVDMRDNYKDFYLNSYVPGLEKSDLGPNALGVTYWGHVLHPLRENISKAACMTPI